MTKSNRKLICYLFVLLTFSFNLQLIKDYNIYNNLLYEYIPCRYIFILMLSISLSTVSMFLLYSIFQKNHPLNSYECLNEVLYHNNDNFKYKLLLSMSLSLITSYILTIFLLIYELNQINTLPLSYHNNKSYICIIASYISTIICLFIQIFIGKLTLFPSYITNHS